MVLDHIHYIFGFTGWIPDWFSMLGRLSAPLFLFCAVEGFTHTRSRKTYFLRVYALSVLMTGLLLVMNLLGVLVRPDGFYPMNGIMTTFAVLTLVWQGTDWLGEGLQKPVLRLLSRPYLYFLYPVLGAVSVPQLRWARTC